LKKIDKYIEKITKLMNILEFFDMRANFCCVCGRPKGFGFQVVERSGHQTL